MPATPAWPPASTPRLFVADALAADMTVALADAAANYLLNVMRRRPGDPVRLCDNQTGEWLATVATAERRRLLLRIERQLRPREEVPDLWLLFAPLKQGRIDWLVEKATELGVRRLQPVLTARTVVDRVNLQRLHAHLVEAAEQCDRTALPDLAEPVALARLIAGWDSARALLFADETGGVAIAEAARPGAAALLIGPEGGFTPEERALIRGCPAATGISLGPRILRAETAALAGVATWMAAAGDWG